MTTPLTPPISRLASAREPDASAGRASGTRTTTGYAGVLAVVDWPVVPDPVPVAAADGSRLMEVTEPGTELVAPCGVTRAVCPTCTAAIDASGTLTVTSAAPAPTMTMLSPWAEVPFTTVTEPTVPAMDAFRVAEARSVWALLSAACALVTAAWSETTRVAAD